MASRLNPYLSFPGNAAEAMRFYREVFGGDLAISVFGEYGTTDAVDSQKVMHGQLDTPAGFTLMGADVPPGADHVPGNNVAVSLSGDDAAELRGYWEKLSEGGTVPVPLETQMWGDEFGMCVDRYGAIWMVNIGQPRE